MNPAESARLHSLEAENQRLRSVLHTTTDAIVILDSESIVRFINPAAEKLFGRGEAELIGAPFGFPVVVGETAELDILRPDGQSIIAELRVGESRWDGKPATVASLRDCTERRQSEERERELIREQAARLEAEASEQLARFLVDAGARLSESLEFDHVLRTLAELTVPFLADWSLVDAVESDGAVRRVAVHHADPAKRHIAAELLPAPALTPANPMGSPPAAQLIPDVLSSNPSPQLDSIAALMPRSVMIVPLAARGRTFGIITLVSAESGRRYQHRDLVLAEELASRTAIATDNARLYQEARDANRAKSDFLAIMSHELRTPLNAVIGYADLLLAGIPSPIPADAQTHANRIRAGARHLLRLIEEVLTFTRVEAGRERIELESFDPRTVIEDVIATIRPLMNRRPLRLTCELPENPTLISTDPTKLQQILLNLMTNAVKFTDEGEIGIRLRFDPTHAHFEVWDTGIGLQPDHLEQAFEPFWQAEQSRTRRADGTGLGLTVARRLSQLLGGEIRVRSAVQRGTHFWVSIPLQGHQPAVLPADPPEPTRSVSIRRDPAA
jgi:signal transduction histidine kinase/PAS domain-containing protein